MINKEYFEMKVDEIVEVAGDYEKAHSKEDSLYAEFILYIAGNFDDEVGEVANIILKTKRLDFPRYCA